MKDSKLRPSVIITYDFSMYGPVPMLKRDYGFESAFYPSLRPGDWVNLAPLIKDKKTIELYQEWAEQHGIPFVVEVWHYLDENKNWMLTYFLLHSDQNEGAKRTYEGLRPKIYV